MGDLAKAALRQRKKEGLDNAFEWIEEYLQSV